jgi:hypothetical protein
MGFRAYMGVSNITCICYRPEFRSVKFKKEKREGCRGAQVGAFWHMGGRGKQTPSCVIDQRSMFVFLNLLPKLESGAEYGKAVSY